MAKGTTETLQFGITPELKEKVNNYANIKYVDENGKEKTNKKNDLFNDLLEEFFKNKVVTNDFIKLDAPFYFNFEELINNNFVECTTNEPTNNFNDYYKINMVPNNLDSYNPDYKTFCNRSRLHHKGILINCFYIDTEFKYFYLLFEFELTETTPKLKINLLDPTEIIYNTDILNNEDVLNQMQEKENEIKQAIKTHQDINYNISDAYIDGIIEDDQNGKIDIDTHHFNNASRENVKLMLYRKGNNSYFDPLLILVWSNYYFIRPYTLEHTFKAIVKLCETNPEIKKYIESKHNITLEDAKQFLKDYHITPQVYILFRFLKPGASAFNLTNLLDMHNNKRTYKEQYTEDQHNYYRKIIIEKIKDERHTD